MSFIPFAPTPTTPRARALAKELGKTIETFRKDDPRTQDQDVRRALQLASSRQGNPDKIIVLIMVALGLVVFLLASGLFFSQK